MLRERNISAYTRFSHGDGASPREWLAAISLPRRAASSVDTTTAISAEALRSEVLTRSADNAMYLQTRPCKASSRLIVSTVALAFLTATRSHVHSHVFFSDRMKETCFPCPFAGISSHFLNNLSQITKENGSFRRNVCSFQQSSIQRCHSRREREKNVREDSFQALPLGTTHSSRGSYIGGSGSSSES